MGERRSELAALGTALGNLNATYDKLLGSIKTLQETAESAMNETSGKAIAEIGVVGAKAKASLKETTDAMTGGFRKDAELFSETVRGVQEQAKEFRDQVDGLMQQVFDTGRQMERLDEMAQVFQFISSGKGKPDEVFPKALDFLKQLAKWEQSRPSGRRTHYLERTIEETRENWKDSSSE